MCTTSVDKPWFQVLDKDTLFVPSGYDSLERITVLNDHTKTGSYEEVLSPHMSERLSLHVT